MLTPWRRRARWGLLLGLLGIFCGCGGDGSGGAGNGSAGQPDVAGTYEGTIQDSLAGQGTVVVTIAQNGSLLTGTWQATFATPANSRVGSVRGQIIAPSVTLILLPSEPGSCPYNVTAVLDGSDMNGSYTAFDCPLAVSGTLDLSRH